LIFVHRIIEPPIAASCSSSASRTGLSPSGTDGSAYGSPVSPRLVDAHAKVFAALRHLGFRESEVKTVLGELRDDADLDGASVERLLREALCRIRPIAR
jgi:Holliday junction resolvasome RuvABC DNA-binding subunit